MAKEPEVRQDLRTAIGNNPKLGLFVSELTLRDGDVGGAAEAVGWTKGYGRKLVKRYPEIRAAVNRLFEQTRQNVRERWAKMHDRALVRISELLENPDPRIVLDAAKITIERVEGRPRQGIDLNLVEREEDAMESVRYRFALAIATEYAMDLEAALQHADENPDQMQSWWDSIQDEYGEAVEA